MHRVLLGDSAAARLVDATGNPASFVGHPALKPIFRIAAVLRSDRSGVNG